MTAPIRECDLTTGERLRVYRRRMGLTRHAAAKLLKRSPFWVAEVERGARDMDGVTISWHGPRAMSDSERCMLYRLRAGRTQLDVAESLGLSRLWVNKMERGEESCDPLVWYWEQRK